jgi:hypothetical protein
MSDLDTIALMVVMLAFGIVLLFGDLLLTNFQSQGLCSILNGTALQGGTNQTCVSVLASGNGLISTFDSLFIFFYFAAIMASVFLASQTPSNPMFWIITLFTSIAVILTAPIIANIYLGLLNTGSFAAIEANHGLEIWFFQNLPVLTIFAHLLVGFVLHGKPQGGGGGGVPPSFS